MIPCWPTSSAGVCGVSWKIDPSFSSSTEIARAETKYHSLSRMNGPPIDGFTSWMFVMPSTEVRPCARRSESRLSACHAPSVKPP